jgi:hypothetical protein
LYPIEQGSVERRGRGGKLDLPSCSCQALVEKLRMRVDKVDGALAEER